MIHCECTARASGKMSCELEVSVSQRDLGFDHVDGSVAGRSAVAGPRRERRECLDSAASNEWLEDLSEDRFDQVVDAEPGNELQRLPSCALSRRQYWMASYICARRVRTLDELLEKKLSHQRMELECVFARCEAEIRVPVRSPRRPATPRKSSIDLGLSGGRRDRRARCSCSRSGALWNSSSAK